jgi:hypothetical protein
MNMLEKGAIGIVVVTYPFMLLAVILNGSFTIGKFLLSLLLAGSVIGFIASMSRIKLKFPDKSNK